MDDDATPEPHAANGLAQRLNWLRAGVLGANDGIVSVAAVVVGVSAATTGGGAIVAAGVASLVGGAVSMALGEYVSVSSQSDSQKTLIAVEARELLDDPGGEVDELVDLYQARGLTRSTARLVAVELTAIDPLRAHLSMELGIAEDDVASPARAAVVSAISFVLGAMLPLLAMILPPAAWQLPVTVASSLIALALTGWIGATLGNSPRGTATVRVVLGGALALAATYLVGRLFGAVGAG